MKKIVLSTIVALAATSAFAQSNVEVYGKMRIYQESYKAGTAGALTQQSNDASRLGFKGSEDMGGGLKANFAIETGIGADSPSATTMGDRQVTVGLSTSNGSIDLGRSKQSLARTYDKYDALGNAVFSSISAVHANQGSRLSNGTFITVKPIKGVSVDYQYGSSEVAGTPATHAGAINADFGPASFTVARYDNGQTSSSNVIAGKFNLAATGTTISAIYSDDEVAGVKTKGKSVGVTQTIAGPLSAVASYGSNENLKAYDAGLNYSLSKRTTLLARYIKQDNNTDSSDVQRVALGIEHNF